jgi:hypothetical protein
MTIEVTNETKIDFVTARKELGDGPMRFAPTGERSIAEQIAALTEAEKKCFDNLKEKWEKTYEPFSDEMYLRFARCSPGKEKFNEKTAFKVMKSFPRRYLELNAIDLEKQLATKVIHVFSCFACLNRVFLVSICVQLRSPIDTLPGSWFADERRSRSVFHVSCPILSQGNIYKNHY